MGANAAVTPEADAPEVHQLTKLEVRIRSLALRLIQVLDPLMEELDELAEEVARIQADQDADTGSVPMLDSTDQDLISNTISELGSNGRMLADALTAILGRSLVHRLIEDGEA